MKTYIEETDGGRRNSGNVLLQLSKVEAQNLVNLVEAVAELKPRQPLGNKFRLLAKRLRKETDNISCF